MKKISKLIDGVRGSVGEKTGNSGGRNEAPEFEELLKKHQLQLGKIVRHGFPYNPTALAYDPVQSFLAVGTKSGSIRILGKPGVDWHCRHDSGAAVIQLQFLVNDGALLSICDDNTIYLWTIRQKKPEIVHSLKFARERLTQVFLPFQSKFFYVGTDRGNVNIVNIESFSMSGYLINWNKAIDVSCKTHPGPVCHLSDCPIDPNKLLIGFESGQIVLWDLKSKSAEARFYATEEQCLKSISWHHEGKQFMCSHFDGSLTVWNVRTPQKPLQTMYPHAKVNPDGKQDACRVIPRVEWKTTKSGESYILFSGGLPYDKSSRNRPCLTVIYGKHTTVLEMEHPVITFQSLADTPYQYDIPDPSAIVVLLCNDLIIIDLTSTGYPCFENPYPMDLHESPVTCCQYYADCPHDLIPVFYSVGAKQKRTGYSDKVWPIKGGETGSMSTSYPEIILTGHADGSIKFWDATATQLQVLYKVKTGRLFEKPKASKASKEVDAALAGLQGPGTQAADDDPYAITLIALCKESRIMCVAGASGQVMVFRFSKVESSAEIPVIDIPITYEINDDLEFPGEQFDYPPHSPPRGAHTNVDRQRSTGSQGSHGSNENMITMNAKNSSSGCPIKVKSGAQKKSPGFQCDFICLTCWQDGEPPAPISALTVNSAYGLMAYGNESGIALVDLVQKICFLNMGTPDLYGSADPYHRVPKSPGKRDTADESMNQDVLDLLIKETSAIVSELQDYRSESDSVNTVSAGNELKQDAPTPPSRRGQHMEARRTVSSGATGQVAEQDGVVEKDTTNRSKSDTRIDDLVSVGDEEERVTYQGSGTRRQTEPSITVLAIPQTQGAAAGKRAESVAFIETPPKAPPRRSRSEKGKKQQEEKREEKEAAEVEGGGHLCDPVEQAIEAVEEESCLKSIAEEESSLHPPILPTPSKVKDKGRPNKLIFKPSLRRISKKPFAFVPSHSLSHHPHQRRGLEREGAEIVDLRHDARPPSVVTSPTGEWGVVTGTTSAQSSGGSTTRKGSFWKRPSLFGSEKTDSFCRSRSSSSSSLDHVSSEGVQCLAFTDTFVKKADASESACVWVGTSLGSVLLIILNLPDHDTRYTQPVIVSPSGTIFRLKGAIITISVLDSYGQYIPTRYDKWKDPNQNKDLRPTPQTASTTTPSDDSPTSSSDKQLVVICSEKQARVLALPSQTCLYQTRVSEASFVVTAEVVPFINNIPCLACYIANGHLVMFSLPSLKTLLDKNFLPLTELRIARTFSFSSNGHALYMCSPTELQKLTFSSETCSSIRDLMGEIFLPQETPEAPRQSFFKNLFGGGQTSLDREELFSEEVSGKASRGIAKYAAGGPSLDQANKSAAGATSEVAKAKQLFIERGEKLSELEDRTAKMMAEAETFSGAAHSVLNKYKDKKWYQF